MGIWPRNGDPTCARRFNEAVGGVVLELRPSRTANGEADMPGTDTNPLLGDLRCRCDGVDRQVAYFGYVGQIDTFEIRDELPIHLGRIGCWNGRLHGWCLPCMMASDD